MSTEDLSAPCEHPRAARDGFRSICLVCGEIGGVKYVPNEDERDYWIDADGIAHKKDAR